MKKLLAIAAGMLLLASVVAFAQMSGKSKASSDKTSWAINAKIIEACSCRLMCPCYFNTTPDKHFCQFNNALNIISGHYGNVNVAGVKVWVSGDLSDNFGDGTGLWAAFTFDPSTTQKQIDAVTKILPNIYPLKFDQTFIDKKPISWEIKGDMATAKIGDGTQGMVELTAFKDASGKHTVINNLTYFGAKSNKGFNLYKSRHHYKANGHDYGFEDANGFVIEIASSGDIK